MEEVARAKPEIQKKTDELVSKGRWDVPGYKERFPDIAL